MIGWFRSDGDVRVRVDIQENVAKTEGLEVWQDAEKRDQNPWWNELCVISIVVPARPASFWTIRTHPAMWKAAQAQLAYGRREGRPITEKLDQLRKCLARFHHAGIIDVLLGAEELPFSLLREIEGFRAGDVLLQSEGKDYAAEEVAPGNLAPRTAHEGAGYEVCLRLDGVVTQSFPLVVSRG